MMKLNLSIKKIRNYAALGFILPLITINFCFLLYKTLGNFDIYPNYDWSKKRIEVSNELYIKKNNSIKSFTNCPIYTHKEYPVNNNHIIDGMHSRPGAGIDSMFHLIPVQTFIQII